MSLASAWVDISTRWETGVPKYRVVWSFPDKAKPGHLGALTFNSDEDAIRETEQILRDRPGAMA
ncbi:MAG: hypothetical protein KJ690_03485, partial [Alphaproteobacteria bacterium]|nr:hypothetical protein [Alphaproteobacteria bacterium]